MKLRVVNRSLSTAQIDGPLWRVGDRLYEPMEGPHVWSSTPEGTELAVGGTKAYIILIEDLVEFFATTSAEVVDQAKVGVLINGSKERLIPCSYPG